MNRINWYFKQSVTFEDMDTSFDSIESKLKDGWKESEHPFGVVTGFAVEGPSLLDILIPGSENVAYDRWGNRIRLVGPLTQNLTTGTDGSSNLPVGAGNERWISVFARAGLRFTDAAVDGNGLNVRKTSSLALNALGMGTHGVGAYDATLAKEAGLDKLYVVAGASAAEGSAVRPALIEDGVLIADIRLIQGQVTLLPESIFFDRRQVLTPATARAQQNDCDLYTGQWGFLKFGVTEESSFSTSADGFYFYVTGGRGYVSAAVAPEDPNPDHAIRRYDLRGTNPVVAVAPDPALSRQDLIVVDQFNQVKVVPGVAGTGLPPEVPLYSVALAEVQAQPGTSDTVTWPIVRRAFRQVPFPFSTMTGIFEGCRLHWRWVTGGVGVNSVYIASQNNKLLFGGDLVEFQGGLLGSGEPALYAAPDGLANPLGVAATGQLYPYFIYACRNAFWWNNEVTGPVQIIESTTKPDPLTGHPLAEMEGMVGTIDPQNALVIGMGWMDPLMGGSRVPVIQSDDGWFYPQKVDTEELINIGASMVVPGSPDTLVVDRVQVRISVIPRADFPVTLQFTGTHDYGPFTGVGFRSLHQPMSNSETKIDHGDTTLVIRRGRVSIAAANHTTDEWYWQPFGWHMQLPRVQFGGG